MIEVPELIDARGTALSLRQRAPADPALQAAVARILDAVSRDGEAAVLRYTAQFDGVRLQPGELYASRAVMEHALGRVSESTLRSVRRAEEEGARFAESQRARLGAGPWIPASRAAIYLRRDLDVAELAATVGFARAAGVKELVAATPPAEVGSMPGAHGAKPLALAVAGELGISRVLLAGGAHAVALLARECDLVLGSTNRFGAEARRQLAAELAWIPHEPLPTLVIADAHGDLDGLGDLRHAVVLCLDAESAAKVAPLQRPGVRVFRANRDRAVVFAQALRPSQVALFVSEPARWLGELTDAAVVLASTTRAPVEVPLTALLRLQPRIGFEG